MIDLPITEDVLHIMLKKENNTLKTGYDGSCNGFSLFDIMILLGMQRKTGELVVESGNNIGSLLFHEGRILLAFSPYTRAIGDLLVERGVLTDTELLDVLKRQKTGPHTPVGMLLVKTGKVSFQDVELMVHDQIRKAIADFSSWEPILLNFVDKEIRPFDKINLPIYEFMTQKILRSAAEFVAGAAKSIDVGASAT